MIYSQKNSNFFTGTVLVGFSLVVAIGLIWGAWFAVRPIVVSANQCNTSTTVIGSDCPSGCSPDSYQTSSGYTTCNCPCAPSGGGGGGGSSGGCQYSVNDLGCPTGYTGSHTVYTYSDCSTQDYNTCSCPTTTSSQSCPAGYTGTETVTTDCQGGVVSTDTSSCTPVSSCPNGPDGTANCPCASGTSWNGSSCTSTGGGSCPNGLDGSSASCCPSGTSWNGSSCTSTQTCTDPSATNYGGSLPCTYTNGGTCADTYTWEGCNSNVVNQGQPPADTAYQYEYIYSWDHYPYCSSYIGGPSNVQVVNGNCPSVPQTSTISVSDNLSGGWSINGTNGSGSSSITVTPDPSGTTYTITPASISGYAYPPAISNSVTGSGSSFVLFPNQTASFFLSYSTAFDYSLSNSGNTTVVKGGRDQYGQNTITKTLTSGTTQSTDLSISGVPSNVDYSIANTQCSPNCSATVTFTVHSTATAGTYPLSVSGTGGKTTSFNLVVQNSPDIVATCSASPSPALVGNPVIWTGSVSGGVPPYTYTWSGTNIPTSPAPTDNPYTITYSTVGTKTAQLHITDSLGNESVCNPSTGGATVQVNFNPVFKEF